MSEYIEVVQTVVVGASEPSDRHVTGTTVTQTRFGELRCSITLTDDGKPLPPTDEPEHQLHGFCWCQPLVETDTATGNHLFIHRRSIDSPHIETVSSREGLT